MKFPYGICDFRKIITKNFYYCDRSEHIPLLERNEFQLFLRPRRFGKSLLLSMLASYYDIAMQDQFETLFGNLKISNNPTELRNSYFILEWDFSCIDPSGTVDDIKKALYDHINSCIKNFVLDYEDLLPRKVEIKPDNPMVSIHSLISIVRMTPYPIYLLIDEYDNFANEVMMGVRYEKHKTYESLVYEEGALKTLFKTIKSSTKESLFDRIFITGVSPVVMSDLTSGYNIGENIFFEPDLNDLCGFNAQEIRTIINKITTECHLNQQDAEHAIKLMRTYYNGYLFSLDADTPVYNPTMALYFLKAFQRRCKYPRKMLDANLAMDEAKLRYISQIPGGSQMLLKLVKATTEQIEQSSADEDYIVTIIDIEDSFGIQKMISDQSQDNKFMVSFLYYFGVLTIKGLTDTGEIDLKVPNLVMKGLFIERICKMLLSEPSQRDHGILAAKQLYTCGDMEPLCTFVEEKYFKIFRNRDYRWANELTVKAAFLTLLYNDILYIMDSEKEIQRNYTDLTMIIRPDMRQFRIADILIEFKYIKLKAVKLSGKEARELSQAKLQGLDKMKTAMQEAKKQVKDYSKLLKQKYKDLRLRSYTVVALGFERLWWEEVPCL